MKPLKLDITLPQDATWVGETLRGQWLSHHHYSLRLGPDGLLGRYLVSVKGQPVCLYLPQVLDLQEQMEMEPIFRSVARRNATSTKRLKSVGIGLLPAVLCGDAQLILAFWLRS